MLEPVSGISLCDEYTLLNFLPNIYLIIRPYTFRSLSRPFYFNFMWGSRFSKRWAIKILFLGEALCSPVEAPLQLAACCLHSIILEPEERRCVFLREVGGFLLDYATSHPWRNCSSSIQLFRQHSVTFFISDAHYVPCLFLHPMSRNTKTKQTPWPVVRKRTIPTAACRRS
jgi:hypothetical protein